MTGSHIEQILGRYRPAQPPHDLAPRVLTAPVFDARASRGWALGAAALLIAAIALHGRIVGGVAARSPEPTPAAVSREISELTQTLGGDSFARTSAELIVAHEYQRGVQ